MYHNTEMNMISQVKCNSCKLSGSIKCKSLQVIRKYGRGHGLIMCIAHSPAFNEESDFPVFTTYESNGLFLDPDCCRLFVWLHLLLLGLI